MPNSEDLNDAVATAVMGWHHVADTRWYDKHEFTCQSAFWCPAERIEDAWTMEEALQRQGLASAYAVHLSGVVFDEIDETGGSDYSLEPHWHLIHATPEQRCRAALALVRSGDTGGGGHGEGGEQQ